MDSIIRKPPVTVSVNLCLPPTPNTTALRQSSLAANVQTAPGAVALLPRFVTLASNTRQQGASAMRLTNVTKSEHVAPPLR